MSFDFMFQAVEAVDAWLSGMFDGAPLLVALGIAFVLGLRHASDPDHLVAVTSLVAAEDGDPRAAMRLGAWWGAGHGLMLLAVGLPLIALKSELPGWLERGAELGVGVVILILAARVCLKWARGDYRAGRHEHPGHDQGANPAHMHLRRGRHPAHSHQRVRTPAQAFGIGLLHGLAGTGAVVVLMLAGLGTTIQAAAALAVFAPMTLVSMAGLTTLFAWVLTRRVVEPIYRAVMIPALGVFGLVFGLWYVGLA